MKRTLYNLYFVSLVVVCINSTTLGWMRKPEDKEPKPSSYGDRPRGIPYARGPLYATGDEFTCFDGSKTIQFDQVNDDYCDCADGSDEPGTSACAKGIFHCLNRGHKSKDIPSSRVNDQICDCCDGSDEWDSPVDCPNICEELGAKHREESQRRKEVAQKGYIKRLELSVEGQKMKEEKEQNINELRKGHEDLKNKKDQCEIYRKEAEEKEKEAKDKFKEIWEEDMKKKKREMSDVLFGTLDINHDKKLMCSELQAFTEFDTDKNGEVTEEEVKNYLVVDECDADYFAEHVYESVKLLFMRPVTMEEVKAAEENKLEEKAAGESDERSEKEDKVHSIKDGEDMMEGSENNENSDEEDKHDYRVNKNELHEDIPPYDEETKHLIEVADAARKECMEVQKLYDDLDEKLREAESFLGGDYGTDFAWAPMKNLCIDYDENQYVYKVCLFDRAVQKDKNSGSETSLGRWKEWVNNESQDYKEQLYDGGQLCWNGPERSTRVAVECGEITELVEASEPAKCEYRFVLRSPAACPDPSTLEDEHDEL